MECGDIDIDSDCDSDSGGGKFCYSDNRLFLVDDIKIWIYGKIIMMGWFIGWADILKLGVRL